MKQKKLKTGKKKLDEKTQYTKQIKITMILNNMKQKDIQVILAQSSLLDDLKDFNDGSRLKTAESKTKKRNTHKSAYTLYEDREPILNTFRNEMFPIKTQGKGLRILTAEKYFNDYQQLLQN